VTDEHRFGGTDGTRWFNDVWTYDPRTNAWSELDCIGYIPAPREGHAAALVNDTMYIFGGRVQDGSDLGDLAAFRISTRRWYMFQNMGMSPSPRSGHSMTAYGKHIIVLGGEPSSAPRDINELNWSYILDTSKIRYPPTEQTGPQQQQQAQQQPVPTRKFSGERPTGIPQSKSSSIPVAGGQQPQYRGSEAAQPTNAIQQTSRLPRSASAGGVSPQPLQQARINGSSSSGNTPRSRTPTQAPKQSTESSRAVQYERENMSPVIKDVPADGPGINGGYPPVQPSAAAALASAGASRTGSLNASSRSGSRAARQQDSVDSTGRQMPRASADDPRRDVTDLPVDSGVGSSPALSQPNDDVIKELEAAKSRNAWYAAELALAKKAGYQPSSSNNPILDQQAADIFADDDKPLIEALLRMRQEIARIQGSMEQQADTFAARVADIEKQRDAAVTEAAYAKAKLAAHGGGSQAGTPQPDVSREAGSPELDRADDMGRRLANTLKQNNDLNFRLEALAAQLEAERTARQLAEDTADAAQRRVSELDSYRQVSSSEVESLRAELHEAQRTAREETANFTEAQSTLKLLEVDKSELSERHGKLQEEHKAHASVLNTLREALNASSDKASLLERKLEEERDSRSTIEQKLAQIKAQHEERTIELENMTRRLRDAEELAEKHAEEARTHREAVLSGLNTVSSQNVGQEPNSDQRVAVLQQQLESASLMARKNKDAADTAANRLRSAEERIAGLEAYQEQASRDALAIRKQLQVALRDVQASQAEKNEIQQRTERNALESNALQVQLSTLKNLLEERGMSAVDVRRSRALESPSSRYGTPELNRVRELERQLDESLKGHEELRLTFEQREQEVAREWEEKLAALDNDHQGAVKYVRGLEKMLAKMKQELQRTKSANVELEKEIAQQKAVVATRGPESSVPPSGWEQEREALRRQISEMQESFKSSIASFESQVAMLKSTLAETESQRHALQQSSQESQATQEAQIRQLSERARSDLDALRHENALLEGRAREAEHKVQMFLDQFESSVDNYRRMSRVEHQRGVQGHRHHDSIAGESMYSTTTDADDDDDDEERASTASGEVTPSAHSFPTAGLAGTIGSPRQGSETLPRHERDRSSTALDGLASELEALRTHWETTNKNYRLSDRFEFERSPPTPSGTLAGSLGLGLGGSAGGVGKADDGANEREGMSESLASWRRRLEGSEGEKENWKEGEEQSKGDSAKT
jgi:Kelch motif